MKKAIILHGMPPRDEFFSSEFPSPSNRHWIPWLQSQLIRKDILTQTPELPKPYAPEYGAWKAVFESLKPDDQTILIGHSCGGGFLVRWLSENKVHCPQLILVAPWMNPVGGTDTQMFGFDPDPGLINRVGRTDILISSDDDPSIIDTVDVLRKAYPEAKVHEFEGKGHFTENDLGSTEFPDLLDLIK